LTSPERLPIARIARSFLLAGIASLALTVGAAAQCACDCDGNGRVAVNDLIRLVHVSLGNSPISRCPGFASIQPDIAVIVSCVAAALEHTDCPPPSSTRAAVTATATPTGTATATASATATPSSTGGLPSPTDAPTDFPPPDAAAAALATELVEATADRACQTGFTPGGSTNVNSTPSGARLDCGSFTGHNGYFELVKYPSTEAALDRFGSPRPEETVDEIGDGTLRELRWTPPCCPHLGGVSTSWAWQRGCWLAHGSTFDDTHYIFTPQGGIVVAAFVESGQLEQLLTLCAAP
jgi:hypothetical protein